MTRILAAVFSLLSTLAFAQVRVDIRPEKATFLEGEPLFFVADVTNVGQYPIGYGSVGHDLQFTMDGLGRYQWREGCESIAPPPPLGPVDHPPTFAPGKTVSFRYLLRGYRLKPGRHEVRVAGTAPVRWFTEFVARPPDMPQSPRIPFKPSDAIEGATVDRAVSVEIVPATTDGLRQIFDSLLAHVSFDNRLEVEAIYETAPPFLEDEIAKLAGHPNFHGFDAFQALADINTPTSRAHLRRLYDTESDLRFRNGVVAALAQLTSPDDTQFLLSLLPGRNTALDDRIRAGALDGLKCIGVEGDQVALAIAPLIQGEDNYLRTKALRMLGFTRSRAAVALLIAAASRNQDSFDEVCDPLRILTHYDWCERNLMGDDSKIQPERWTRWWQRHSKDVRIHGRNDAPPEDAVLPKVR